MPGPFPGIDPYIEAQGWWHDFHPSFITYCCDALSDRLPDQFEAVINERYQRLETEVEADPERHTWVEIRRLPERSRVGIVELLSPRNKTGLGRGEYLTRRTNFLRGLVDLIELDFLLGGRRLPMGGPLPGGDCYAIIARAGRRPDADVYAWSVRQPLPVLPIPLRAPDPDLPLDLAAVYATTYERGRYARRLDYTAPLTVPLAAADRTWAEGQARAARK
jgi:hypothetical protein